MWGPRTISGTVSVGWSTTESAAKSGIEDYAKSVRSMFKARRDDPMSLVANAVEIRLNYLNNREYVEAALFGQEWLKKVA